MRVLCALNPRSADGLAQRRWPAVERILRALNADVEVVGAEGGDLGALVQARLEGASAGAFAVIAGIGGDGTHAGIINALMALRARRADLAVPPYAFIPLGTGNDIAKSFGLTSREDFFVDDLRRAVSTALHGADYHLDLGRCAGRFFADALTIGLDSAVLHERNVRKRRVRRLPLVRHVLRGPLLYTYCLGLRFWRQAPVNARITVDGRIWHDGPMINLVLNNTQIYAGEFFFSRESYGNDGLLDAVLFTDRRNYLARYLLSIRHNPGRIREFSESLSRLSSHVQGRQFRVELSRPEAAQMDGEEFPTGTAFDIEVVPGAIWVKTPAEPV